MATDTLIATVEAVTGEVYVRNSEGQMRLLKSGDQLFQGDVVIPANGGSVDLDLADGNPMKLDQPVEVTMTQEMLSDEYLAAQQSAISDDSVATVLAALETGQDLSAVLPEPAGGESQDEGHNFVRLLRIVEELSPNLFPPTAAAGDVEQLADPELLDQAESNPPVAADDNAEVNENDSVVIDVLANDTDPDGDLLPSTLTIVSEPQFGDLSIDPDTGAITYSPNDDYVGEDSFSYEVSDAAGNTSGPATVSILVNPVNEAPLAQDDTYDVDEDLSLVADGQPIEGVLFNDTDPDGDQLTVNTTPVSDVSNGTLVLNSDGTFTYTPDEDFYGEDSFTYEVSDGDKTDTATVTITVNPVNDAPVAADDQYSILEDTTLTVDGDPLNGVLFNDTDVEGDNLMVNTTPVSDVSHGTLTLNNDGTFTYIPDANFFGEDSFIYEVSDGDKTDTATVTITVTPDNDAPLAADDQYSILEDTTLTVDGDPLNGVLFNDTDVEGDSLTVNTTPVSDVSHGTLTLNSDGTFTYVPDQDFFGEDSFVYEVSDGDKTDTATVTITVTPDNDAPEALDDQYSILEDTTLTVDGDPLNGVLFNDTDVEGDSLTVNTTPISDVSHGTLTLNSDGTFTYVPDPDFFGEDSFVYEVSDGDKTDTATVTITVTPDNDAPLAADDQYSILEDTTLTVDGDPLNGVLFNDTDVEGDSLTVNTTPVSDVSHGTLTLNSDGTFTYVPDQDFFGEDSFVYEVSDGDKTDTATVSITVTPDNDAPLAADDQYSILEDTTLTVDGDPLNGVLFNDTDVEGDSLTVNTTPISDVSHGTLTLNSDGTFTYVPDQDFFGEDSFVYEVSDGDKTDTATVTITVTPDNDAPLAADDQYSILEDTTLTVDGDPLEGVLFNDSDVEGDSLTVNTTPVSDVSNGTLTLNSDGTFTYIPDPDFFGEDSFVYEVSDGDKTDTATVTITVTPDNDAPLAADDQYSILEDTTLTVDGDPLEGVLFNDTDVDGDSLTVNTTPVSDVSHGTLTLNSDGTFTYIPDENFFGEDSFVYEVSDGDKTDTATVTITVEPDDEGVTLNMNGSEGDVFDLGLLSPADDSETTNGSFKVTAPDGLASITFSVTIGGVLIINTLEIDDLNGATAISPIEVFSDEDQEMVITGYNPDDGTVSYSYTLLDTVDHQPQDDSQELHIGVVATDTDGDDSLPGTIVINQIDDQPEILSVSHGIGLNGETKIVGSLSVDPSADDPQTFDWGEITTSTDLYAGNEPVLINSDPDSQTVTGTLEDGTLVFTLTLNEDLSSYTYEQYMPLQTLSSDVAIGGDLSGGNTAEFMLQTTSGPVTAEISTTFFGFEWDPDANGGTGAFAASTVNTSSNTMGVGTGQNVDGLADEEDHLFMYFEGGTVTEFSFSVSDPGNKAEDLWYIAYTEAPFDLMTDPESLTYTDLPGTKIYISDIADQGTVMLDFDEPIEFIVFGSSDGASYKLVPGDLSVTYFSESSDITLTAPFTVEDSDGDSAGDSINIEIKGDADTIAGDEFDNALGGNEASNTISGLGGNDTLTGGDGSDVFAWHLNDGGSAGDPALDVVTDFNAQPQANGGDVLDLSQLLVDEENGDLTDYLHFGLNESGDTVLNISTTAGFSGGYDEAAVDQSIQLNGVNLVSDYIDVNNVVDQSSLIDDLKDSGNLITD